MKLFSNIKGDFFGGLIAGIVALPLALAFGEQTELGALAGLYGAIALAILAAIFGGTNTQISGPTAPMTVVSAAIILDAIKSIGSLEAAFPVIIATFVLSGALQILFGLLRVGSFIRYIPYPVVSGFMSGIGCIIVITQIFPFFGQPSPEGGAFGILTSLPGLFHSINFYALALSTTTLLIIYLFPRVTKKVPSQLVAIIVLSTAAFFLIPKDAVFTIGSGGAIANALPSLHWDFLSVFTEPQYLLMVFEYAFTLAALGAIDSLLTSVVADNMTKTRHNSNQELIGQGIGNMASGLIGGLPGAGATMRTVININSGGKTKLSGVIAGLFLLAVLLGLSSLVGFIPNAVLAGILVAVGIGILDYKGFAHMKVMPRTETAVMILVLFLTVFLDLLIAVAAGMICSAFLFMKKVSEVVNAKTYSEPLKHFSVESPWIDEQVISPEISSKIYIKHLHGPLFFGFASRFQEMVHALPLVEVVVLRFEKVPYVDQSGLYAMEEAVMNLQSQGISVVFVGIKEQPEYIFKSISLIPNLVPEEHIFSSFESCLAWLDSRYGNQLIQGNMRPQTKESQDKMKPRDALDFLKQGNRRFFEGCCLHRHDLEQINATANGQYPFAAVLSCIDSRVPVEKIFDQGIGDIFNARVAGNVVNEDVLGSLEFACKVAGSKLILVLGHTSCGAVKGVCDAVELGNLTVLLDKIKPAVDSVKTEGERSSENKEFVEDVMLANVNLAIDDIFSKSSILKEMQSGGEIMVIGAYYDVSNGQVRFLDPRSST